MLSVKAAQLSVLFVKKRVLQSKSKTMALIKIAATEWRSC